MKTLQKLHLTNIIYLEGDRNYTILHLENGQKLLSSVNLKRYQADDRLTTFLRISKSFLLNPIYIENIEKRGIKTIVKLKNKKQVVVSRRRLSVLMNIV
jgi:DNA-binding LytR/AlgR family response regulator